MKRMMCGLLALALAAGSATASDYQPRVGKLELALTSAFDSNLHHDQEYLESVGGILELDFEVEAGPRDTRLTLGYEGSASQYTNSSRYDRVSHEASGEFRKRFGPRFELLLSSEFDSRISTEDRELFNQVTTGPELTFRPTDHTWIDLDGALRFRRAPDNPVRNVDVLLTRVRFRVEPWEGIRLDVAYRYEDANGLRDPEESYVRHRIELGYRARFGDRNRFEVELQGRRRSYPERIVETGPDAGASRLDYRIAPSARLVYGFGWGQEFEVLYEFQKRTSNDPDEEYTAHRIEMSVITPLVR